MSDTTEAQMSNGQPDKKRKESDRQTNISTQLDYHLTAAVTDNKTEITKHTVYVLARDTITSRPSDCAPPVGGGSIRVERHRPVQIR